MQTVLQGFGVSIGLIVAIGAQNAWVLGKSIRGIHPFAIATVCLTIDALLMAIGVVALKQVQEILPGIVPWMTWAGILMLCWLAGQAYWRAWHQHNGLEAGTEDQNHSLSGVIITAVTISLLNPHVYLDTVVLIGGLASISDQPWLFWTGGAMASAVWFLSLAAVGKPLSRWLVSVKRWQAFEVLVGSFMLWIAYGLYGLN